MNEEERKTEKPEAQTPPTEYVTKRGRRFEFGRPGLKHRGTVMKVLKVVQNQHADYDAIIECAKAREMTVEQFIELPETDYTEEEKRKMLKSSSQSDNMEFAEMMNEVLVEVLYATIKKAPFLFESMSDFEEKMDDYAEAVELFPIATRWISAAAKDMRGTNRPN